MADFEKTFSIKFDTAAAEKGIKRIERMSKRIEDKLKKIGLFSKDAGQKYSYLMAKKGERAKARAIGKVAKRIRSVGTSAKFSTGALGGLLGKIYLIVGAVGKIRDIGRDWMEFDATMHKSVAKFSKLEPELAPGTQAFKDFKKEIRGASLEVEHSAAGVASAVDFWAKAGKSSTLTKAVVPATLDFASANTDAAGTMLDVAQAGDILSDTLGQFQLDSKDPTKLMENTARVSDVMSAAANSANFSATEMFESFKTAGPILTAVGGDIEETAALLAVMANAGLKGSIAGRSLKIATAAINAPTARQIKLYKKYNIVTRDAEGNMLKLTDIVGQLDYATKDLGTGERFGIFAQLFGRQGVTGFLNLIAKGHGVLGQMTDDLRAAGGETKRLAEITRQSATAQMQKFWNKIENIGFTLIEETQLFEKLGEALNNVDWEGAAKWISDYLVPALSKAIDLVGSMFTALKALAAMWAISKLTGAVNYFGAISKGAGGAATSLKDAVKQAGYLNSALSVVQAGIAGWAIGAIIHDELVEPLMKAHDQAEKLRLLSEEVAKKDKDPRKTFNADDLRIQKQRLEQLKKQKRKEEARQAGLGFAPSTSSRSVEIATVEARIKRIERVISIKDIGKNTEKRTEKGKDDFFYVNPATTGMTQNVQVAGSTFNIDAKNADAKEVGKIVKKVIREHDRDISNRLHNAARNESALEL